MNWPGDFINKIICGDCLKVMKEMPDESIDMAITSPPYWGLRDYGIEQIFGGDKDCEHDFSVIHRRANDKSGEHGNVGYIGAEKAQDQARFGPPIKTCSKCGGWKGQLGLEPTPEMYIEHLTEIFNEVKRVLKKEGTLFLNMGDIYWGGKGRSAHGDPERHIKRLLEGKTINKPHQEIGRPGEIKPGDGSHDFIQPKCLCMIPERLAWSLIQNGWILRNKNIWEKKNNLPCSAKDRFTNRWEYIFYFVKSRRNYFNLNSVREPLKSTSLERMKRGRGESQRYALFSQYGGGGGLNKPRLNIKFNYRVRDAIKKGKEAPMFKASIKEIEKYQNQDTAECNSKGKNPGDVWPMSTACFPYDYCITCKRLLMRNELIFKAKKRYCPACKKETMSHFSTFPTELCAKTILPGCPEGGIVLDPFAGAGTALFVAKQLRRKFLGIDIKKEYCEMSEKRLAQGVL